MAPLSEGRNPEIRIPGVPQDPLLDDRDCSSPLLLHAKATSHNKRDEKKCSPRLPT